MFKHPITLMQGCTPHHNSTAVIDDLAHPIPQPVHLTLLFFNEPSAFPSLTSQNGVIIFKKKPDSDNKLKKKSIIQNYLCINSGLFSSTLLAGFHSQNSLQITQKTMQGQKNILFLSAKEFSTKNRFWYHFN